MAAGAASRHPASTRVGVRGGLSADAAALVPGLAAVGLMLLWAVHDGGFDEDTWYWGALVMLSLLAVSMVLLGPRRRPLRRSAVLALVAFGGYVAWSYASMTWAQVPGEALDGGNRSLLYLLMFALFLVLPWTSRTALVALLVYSIGVGVIAIVLMARLATGHAIEALVVAGRLAAPTGYFNSTVALFMFGALLSTALACRRELGAPLRGLLLACAAVSLQLCVLGESRGWLFTLPLVLLAAVAAVRDRVREMLLAALPILAVLIPIHRLLNVFVGGNGTARSLTAAAQSAAPICLVLSVAVLALGTFAIWIAPRLPLRAPSPRIRRLLAAGVVVAAVGAAVTGGVIATHGHPIRFVEAQWNGFSHQELASATNGPSHFGAIGSGRYDFWRVALDAFAAHPVGGLGQDNYADYYILHRSTSEDPLWPHSLELRLLAMTGIVGFLLFLGFLVFALAAMLPARRSVSATGAVAGMALLPLTVWLIHGSIDWFFEVPALSGPALGFLGMAAGLPSDDQPAQSGPAAPRRFPRALTAGLGVCGLLAATVALAFPYLSVREVSMASDATDPAVALAELRVAARLDPWNPEPGRMAGQVALEAGEDSQAELSFDQTIAREPDGWYAWLGAGLAASALGDVVTASHDFRVAAAIDNLDPVIRTALARVLSARPLSPADALSMLAAESGV